MVENRGEGLPSENLRERVKGRACNSPLSRRASVEGVERSVGAVSQRGQRDGNGKRDWRASATKLKEVRNIFMIFPG